MIEEERQHTHYKPELRKHKDRKYPNNAVKQAAYRLRKKGLTGADLSREESHARSYMKTAGYKLTEWKLAHIWEDGTAIFAKLTDPGYVVMTFPETGKARKMRAT